MGRPVSGTLLTAAEEDVLFLLSTGLTYSSVATRRRVHTQTVKTQGSHVIRKLGARNITDAVRIALLEGILGRDRDCGSQAAYQRHRRNGETADPKCLKAKAIRDREQRAGMFTPDARKKERWSPLEPLKSWTVPPGSPTRRVRSGG